MLVVDKKVNDAWSALSKELNIKIKIDGVVYDKSDVSSLSFDSASIVGDAFQIGSAYMNQIQVEFPSIIESIAQDLEVTAELGIYVDGAFHYSKLGTFLISEFDRNRNERKTTFTAVDRMVLLEGSYVSKLSYPASIRNVALEIANLAGVVIDQVSFSTLPTTTIAKPEGYTYRQAIGLIAQFVGGFANFNREGKLQVRTLALTDFTLTTADYMWSGFTKNESTYRVNGIQVITGDEESNVLSVGADKGNVIQLENKVMTQALLNTIWQKAQGVNYFPFELKWFGNPNLEAGDWINIVDHDGVRYSVPNLSYSFTYNGGLRAESKATTTSNSEVSYRYKGTLAQKIIEIEKVLTAANGWNSNYYDQTHPPLHPKEGDAWFKPNGAYTEIWLYKNVDGELKWVLEISNAPDEAIKEAIENMEQEVQTAIDQSNTAINNANQAVADLIALGNQVEYIDSNVQIVQNEKEDKTVVAQLADLWQQTTALADGHATQIASMGTAINLRATKTEVDEKILADKTIRDTRNDNQTPLWYWQNHPRVITKELKLNNVLGILDAGKFATLESDMLWSDYSAGSITQTAKTNAGVYQRRSSSNSTWGAWSKIADTSNIVSQINISPESILIASKKIQIKGDTYIDNGVIKSAMIGDLEVTGAKIANATIGSAKIISLDASKITVGTLTGHTINGAVINGGSITGTSITGGTFYNSGSRGDFHVYDGMVKATSYNTVVNGTVLSEGGYITLRAGGTGSGSHVFLQSVTEVRATKPREFSTFIPMVASEFRIPGWTYLARNTWSTYGNGIEDMFVKPSDIGSLRVVSAGNGSYRPVMASAFNQSSSREFKENIKSLRESGLEVVRGFNIVTYNLKDDQNKEIQVGLIAEDNRIISSFEGDSINIYKMTSYNSKAIQELDASLSTVTQQLTTVATERLQHTLLLESKLLSLENTVLQLQQEIEQLRTV